MKIFKSFILISSLLLLNWMTPGQVIKKPFQLTDLRKVVSITEPRISPDGKQVAVIVSHHNWEKDSVIQEIDLVEVSNGSLRSITYSRSEISGLNWSPDGTRLGFISNDDETKKPQVYIMPMNGGDPVRITESKTGVDEFSWSPDGKKIAYVAQDTIPNPKEIKHHEDVFRITDNNYLVRAPVHPWHLWIVSAAGGKAKKLTDGSFSICTDQKSLSPVVWTPDAKSVTFQKFPDVWEGNSWHSVIAEADTGTGEIRTIISDEGSGWPAYSSPGTLSFIRPRGGDLNKGNAVYIQENDKAKDVTNDLARNINYYIWLPDGKGLLLTGYKGTRGVIWKQPLNGKAELIDLEDVNIEHGNLSVSENGIAAFIGSTPQHPAELYAIESLNKKPKRLTNLNSFADSLSLGKTVEINWKGEGGFDEDGVLTYPVNYKEGEKYPLVLVIHGGPEAASTVEFSELVHLLSAQDFFVFQPNYRGSTNLGDEYQHAIFRDTGEGPAKDVMAGLDKIQKMGIIDTNRIGVSGWSYGGYMTSWLNGKYPDKWKAAIEGAALNDWVMDYTISYYQTYDLYFFGGSPWVQEHWDIWREQSPIIFAKNVKAPTLILGNTGDPNVPIINSYEMYHALRDHGVKTEFYAYPVDEHFPSDIVRITDIYKRWVDWMVKYVK